MKIPFIPINNVMKHLSALTFFLTFFVLGCSKDGEGFAPGKVINMPSSNPPVVMPFDPTHITQIHSWYDGADATTMTLSGNQVSVWTDKNNHASQFTQSNSAVQPLLQSNAINGKSALRFDGSNDMMAANISSGVSADTTITYVLQISSYNSKIPFSFNTTTYSYGPDIYFNAGQITWNTGDSNGNPFSNWVIPSTTSPHIVTVKNDSALNQASLYLDGVYVGSAVYKNTSIADFTAPRLYIGNWITGSYYIDGYFAELVIYNKVIDETERADLEYYLKAKWGTP